MTAFSLGARLRLGANSALALSLPPSACSNPLCRHPPPSSEGAEAATAASHRFEKAQAAVKPAEGGLPSSGAVRRRAAQRHLSQGEGKTLLHGAQRRAQSFINKKSRAHFEHGILFVIRIYLEAEAELAEELAALLSITLPGSAATTSVLGFQFAT